MTLRASSFITVVLGFLMVMGYHNQPVEVVRPEKAPEYGTILRERAPVEFEKVKIEVFDDLRCPPCDRFAKSTLQKIRDLEKETGEIDLRVYVIPDINDADLAQKALGLKCAADQDKFWELHTYLHENSASLDLKKFIAAVKGLGLDAKAFLTCVESKKFQTDVESDIRYASEKGISLKPTTLINEYTLLGPQPFENIKKIVSQILRDKENEVKTLPWPNKTTDLQNELEKAFEIPAPETQPQS